MNTPLLAQKQRGAVLRDRLRKSGDTRYHPPEALLQSMSPFFPRFTGYTVAQQSLPYALLLLHSDDRTYGIDDAIEGNRIIRRILEFQDLLEGSETFGNFFWMTHWDRVKDRNAVSFLTIGLVYAYLTLFDKLEPETRQGLEAAFPNILKGIRSHKVRWKYTNIFFLNLGGLVALSRVMDDDSIHKEAVSDFDEWLAGTSLDGFHEFNSPTYTPVTLFGMEAAWHFTQDDTFKHRLCRTMDTINYQLALNIMPNGFLGGAPSRAYQGDAIQGTGSSAYHAHIKFGTPCPTVSEDVPLFYLNLTLFDYAPSKVTRQLAHTKPELSVIQDRGVSLNSTRTHILTPRFSLASQSVDSIGGHSPPSYILLVRDSDSQRRSVPFLPDESFLHQPCATFQSQQIQTPSGSVAFGRLHYELGDTPRQKFLDDPTFQCEPHILFGLREDITSIWIGNVHWGGERCRLLPDQPVTVSYGDLLLGVSLRSLAPKPGSDQGHAWIEWGEDNELRLTLRIHGGLGLALEDEPVDFLALFEVGAVEPESTHEQFAEHIHLWELITKEDSFQAEHADGTQLSYSAVLDPLDGALHVSPDLTLRPGDLEEIVNGDQSVSFVSD
jgi:hypothetical protein